MALSKNQTLFHLYTDFIGTLPLWLCDARMTVNNQEAFAQPGGGDAGL